MRLEGKIAIVTGAGSGFGEGIAKRFADEGARVVVNDIAVANGERVAREIVAAGGAAKFCAGDVSKDADVSQLIAFALAAFGGLDIVVNNAGTTHRNQPMLDVTEDEFDRIYRVNVKSLFLTARHAVPHFRRQRHGVFITIASTAGVRPRPGLTWYNGSKGAAITTSRSMAAELAPDNIRVNVINPVAGETAMLADFMGQDTPAMRAKFVASIPLGRLSLPSDIATAAVFFASDEAAFITGACLEVDGGRCV
ncbi:MAG: glucose 1-dehydrogenase [Betaproteobacteria bacterium]|nr:glucose 1-dehydrogenase [Betaproteobacteria bacterium]MBK7081338.1 glucose 1-dehydrogenase [Betaproteobacteria bacterium]MBK8686960.1 glucose 1-dehydrogenase [Betaproteobacteria bacterium]